MAPDGVGMHRVFLFEFACGAYLDVDHSRSYPVEVVINSNRRQVHVGDRLI